MKTACALMMIGLTASIGCVAAEGPPASATAAACASGADAQRVIELYAKTPAPMPFAAAPQLKLPEIQVAGAIPAAFNAGADGTQWRAVWDSLTQWDHAMVLILKGGNVFEISTRIAKGEPSTRSKFFNLGEASLSGHLRPDLITAIHALKLPTKEGFARGVLFYDASGDSVYGVFLPGEGKEPPAEDIAKFDQTWNLVKGLPQRCGKAD